MLQGVASNPRPVPKIAPFSESTSVRLLCFMLEHAELANIGFAARFDAPHDVGDGKLNMRG
jgi:hypothetical protein